MPALTPEQKPFFVLEIPGRLPSWNDVLGMEQWARYQFKQALADAFLSALRRSAADSSMKITCARSTMLTYADTLASYLAMRREQRKLKSARKRQNRGKASLLESKSSKYGKPPF